MTAIVLLGLAAATLAGDPVPGPPGPAAVAGAAILFLLGAGCAHLFLRYGLARLVLDERGFRVDGPFHRGSEVRWDGVTSWRTVRTGPGPRTLRILHDGRRRLSLPLIYEDAHLVEVGLAQRRFPRI
jgi:hypothetical protein